MKLSLLAPGEVGYYQRIVLDRWSRIPMRLLGLLISLFGLVIFSAAGDALFGVNVLRNLSVGLIAEMGLLFAGMWLFGAVAFVIQAIRGHALDWFRLRRQGIDLGPLAVCPPITPTMSREASLFTLGFFVLVAIALANAIFRR